MTDLNALFYPPERHRRMGVAMDEDNPLIRERRAKLGELRRIGIDPYGARWEELTQLALGPLADDEDARAVVRAVRNTASLSRPQLKAR